MSTRCRIRQQDERLALNRFRQSICYWFYIGLVLLYAPRTQICDRSWWRPAVHTSKWQMSDEANNFEGRVQKSSYLWMDSVWVVRSEYRICIALIPCVSISCSDESSDHDWSFYNASCSTSHRLEDTCCLHLPYQWLPIPTADRLCSAPCSARLLT